MHKKREPHGHEVLLKVDGRIHGTRAESTRMTGRTVAIFLLA